MLEKRVHDSLFRVHGSSKSLVEGGRKKEEEMNEMGHGEMVTCSGRDARGGRT